MIKRRLERIPIPTHDRGDAVTILFEGRKIEAYAGETVAAALLASGVKMLLRSMKYQRPRGRYCLSGTCNTCLMRVDGNPNVRTCQTLVRNGMKVERQKVMPVSGAAVDYLFPDGLHHHNLLTHPRLVNDIFLKAVRYLSGQGKLPDSGSIEARPVRARSAEVAVIGGGPAGLGAALSLSEAGVASVLIDAGIVPGGHIHARLSPVRCGVFQGPGHEVADAMVYRLRRSTCGILRETKALAYYKDGFFCLLEKGSAVKLSAPVVVFATGGYSRIPLFENNDLPGVFAGRGLQRLVNEQGIVPGRRALVVEGGRVGAFTDHAASLASELQAAGVKVAAVVTGRKAGHGGDDPWKEVRSLGIKIFEEHEIARAEGKRAVRGAVAAPLKGKEKASTIRCDVIGAVARPAPAYELPHHMGCAVRFDLALGAFAPQVEEDLETTVPGVFAAGEVIGADGTELAFLQGRLAGIGAAIKVRPSPELEKRRRELMKAIIQKT